MGICFYKFLAVFTFGIALAAQPMAIYTEVYPPDQCIGPDGQLTGFSVEIVREIQKRTNNTDPIQIVPWARGYREALANPNVVLFSVARSAERDVLFEWIGPIKESKSHLYVRSDSKLALDRLEQAKGLERIGVYKDDACDLFLVKEGFTNLDRSVDQGIVLKKLMADRIDAMASVPDAIDDLLRAEGLTPDRVRPACAFMHVQVYLAISKKTPPPVVHAWEEAFRAMKKDGTFRRIYRKYYPKSPLPGPAKHPS